MKVKDVAKLLGMTEQTVRIGLQQNMFPFGTAYKTRPTNKQYVYVIYERKVYEYIGERTEHEKEISN